MQTIKHTEKVLSFLQDEKLLSVRQEERLKHCVDTVRSRQLPCTKRMGGDWGTLHSEKPPDFYSSPISYHQGE